MKGSPQHASAASRSGVLVELDGVHAGRRIALPETLTIGGEATPSGGWRGGAVIQKKDTGRYLVKELDEHSQVYVNDEQVAQARLDDQAFLRIGTASYRFFLDAVEPDSRPAPSPSPGESRSVRCRACGHSVPAASAVRSGGRVLCTRCAQARLRPQWRGRGAVLAGVVILGVALLAWGLSTEHDPAIDSTAETSHLGREAVDATSEPPAPTTTADLVASVEGGVALLSGAGAVGTGFLVADGILATNAHVIEGAFSSEIRVQYPADGRTDRAILGILHEDCRRDLCLLRVETGHPPLRLAPSVLFRRGEEVLMIGNPGVGDDIVLKNAVTQGLMSAITKIDGERFIQISGTVNPGNSGGPVLNRQGEVVCVATLKAGGAEGIAFGIPVTEVTEALRVARRATAEAAHLGGVRHDAQVVFLRLAGVGSAYLFGMYLHVQAMERAMQRDMDPSAALWAAKAMSGQAIRERKASLETGLDVHYHRAVSGEGLDSRLQQRLQELKRCVDDIEDYVENPRGRIARYVASYKRLRVRLASLISQLSHEFGVGEDLESRLPEER